LVFRNLSSLDWQQIVERLEKFATSELTRQKLRGLAPLANVDEAKKSLKEIDEVAAIVLMNKRPFMESLDLFKVWHQRLLRKAVLQTLELKDVRHFCLEVLALDPLLEELNTPWITTLKEQLMDAAEPLSAIDQLMSPDGEIRSDASETLYRLFREKQSQSKQVQQILDKLVKAHETENLLMEKYVTNREGRWVLPVKSGMQHFFEGIIHASSQTKQTVYMEPGEIIPLNNRLRQIEVEMEEEIERLLTELSHYLARLAGDFEKSREALENLDYRLSQAQLAKAMNASTPNFDTKNLDLVEVKHPVLALIDNENVVPNSVQLQDEKRILLLSGPNAGGKTVLLKAVGLAAHMARCGLPICAQEGSKIPFFKNILIAVGDSQSVDAALSTFAAHLKILNDALAVQGPENLILIDEICGSTDPEEGTALARSFIEAYARSGVLGVITSHLGPLKLGWKPESGVVNGSLEYDSKTGKPTYQFLMGIAGQSLAIQTAKRVGVAKEIVDRAMEALSPESRNYQQGLEEIESMKEEVRKLADSLNEQAKQARAEKSKYHALSEKFEREKEKMLEQAVKRADKKIETMIENAQVTETFKKHENLSKMRAELPQVVKASVRPASGAVSIDTAEDFAKYYPAGSKVFVASIGRDGVVQGSPNSKGEVPILSNSMRLMVPWQSLKPPHQAPNPTAELLRRSAHFGVSPAEGDRIVDLRGLSVDEAIEQLEVQLDTAALAQEERVKIVHGHGTETLKRNIRSYLSRSVYVKKWSAGTADTGGDGITWIEIKD